jgi:DNA-binding CsgD family transcriptional regulator
VGPGTWTRDRVTGLSAPRLLEREREQLLASRWIDAARAARGQVYALEGPAGFGKSRLLDAIVVRAVGFEVLRARGTPMERDFPFGVVRDLFEPRFLAAGDELRSETLSGRARPAARVFASDAGSALNRVESGAAIRALFHLTASLAQLKPLLIAIDDVHWCDLESLRFLAYLAPRLAGLRALVILTSPPGELGPTVELHGCACERIGLPSLSEHATAELLEHARPGARRVAARCHAATRGNPSFVVELCRTLADDPWLAPECIGVGVDGLVPQAIGSAVAVRLRRLGAPAVALAEAVAVLGGDARIRVAATLSGLDLETATTALGRLIEVDIVGRASVLDFTAPIVRAAVYQAITPGLRALLHGKAACALAEAGAPNHAVAAHLLLSEPAGNPSTVRALRNVAQAAAETGDVERAVRYLNRALAEPAREEVRAGILLELGVLQARAGSEGAEEILLEVSRSRSSADERATAVLSLAELRMLRGAPADAQALLKDALTADCSASAELHARVRGALIACRIAAARKPEGPWWDARPPAASTRGCDGPLVAAGVAAALFEGEALATLPRIVPRFADARGSCLRSMAAGEFLVFVLAQLVCGHSGRPLDCLEQAADQVGSSNAPPQESVILTLRSFELLRRGTLSAAETQARKALRIAREHKLRFLESLAVAALMESLLDQGRVSDAERELGYRLSMSTVGVDLAGCLVLIARGRLRAVLGDASVGLEDLLTAGKTLVGARCVTPGLAWRSRAALIAGRLGRRRMAAALVSEEFTLAAKQGDPRALGTALRTQAAMSEPDDQLSLLVAAVEALRCTPNKLDYGRALCDLGAAHRRLGSRRDAQLPLKTALQVAHECGAIALAQRARHELVVLGARPRRFAITGVEALTARERQAGELAADGLTNREIAAAMCVTANTVEYHLTNAYRKLGIARREYLPVALSTARVHPRAAALLAEVG